MWTLWTACYTVPWIAAGVVLLILEPLTVPVAAASFAHAWIIPELYAYRGASVLRPKGGRNAGAEPVAQGLLGDLLGHEARELQRQTGLAMERSGMGIWLVGEGGAILLPDGAAASTASACAPPTPTCRRRTASPTCCSPCAPTRRASPPWRTTRSAARSGGCAGACPSAMRPALDAARAAQR